LFADESDKPWCYYFEKADLARQFEDWQQIGQLGDEAEQRGLRTKKTIELVPFIEGYAHLGQWQKTLEYTDHANRLVAMMQPLLCSTWQRIETDTTAGVERDQAILDAYKMLECTGK